MSIKVVQSCYDAAPRVLSTNLDLKVVIHFWVSHHSYRYIPLTHNIQMPLVYYPCIYLSFLS